MTERARRADQMHLVAMVNPPTSQYAENWRHPLGRADWLSADFYTDLARTLERGCFDLVFFADALAVPEDANGNYETTLRTAGKGSIYLDPITLISLAAGATSQLGLGATVSTSFVPPYAIARQLLSVDHLSGGRVAWNIVTSTTDAEARNLGQERIAAPADRYAHADAVVSTVTELWQSWEPGALIADRSSGTFADSARVHRITSSGSRGPLTLPQSRQGHPVLMQAGSSPRGRAFAAQWAEVVFAVGGSDDEMRQLRTELRDRAAQDHGRNPDELRVLQGVQPILGWTDQEASSREDALRAEIDLPAALEKLARLLHADTPLDPAAAATEVLARHRGATGSVGFEDMLMTVATARGYRVADLALEQAMNQLHPQVTGSPETVADQLEHWFESEAADGFIIMPALYHSSFEDVVNGLVPELQRRGLFRTAYSGTTLRDHLTGAPPHAGSRQG